MATSGFGTQLETRFPPLQVVQSIQEEPEPHSVSSGLSEYSGDAPTCPTCGEFTIRSGACYRCLYCGESLGCS